MRSSASRRRRSCRERSNGIRTAPPPATGRAVRTASAYADTLLRNVSARPHQIRPHRHDDETKAREIRGNWRRARHDAEQLHDDAETGPLVSAPCGKGSGESGSRIAGRSTVAIESDAFRQLLAEAARQRHFGMDDRRSADIPDHRLVGARESETDRVGAKPAFGRAVRSDPGRGIRRNHADQPARGRDLGIIGQHAGVPGLVGANDRDARGRRFLDRDRGGAMRDDVAEVIAAIELRRHRRSRARAGSGRRRSPVRAILSAMLMARASPP